MPTPNEPAVAEQNPSPRVGWLVSGFLTLVIAVLHVFFLFHRGGFWRDEVNLLNLAAQDSLAAMSHDSFPLLMPLLVHGWMSLTGGGGDAAIQWLGAVIGLCGLAALWLVARVSHRTPPLAGLVFFGLNSLVIAYGDSLRAYGLGSVLVIFLTGFVWAFLQNNSRWRFALMTLSAVLAVQTLFQNAILVLAVCLGAFAVCLRCKSWRAAVGVFLAGLIAALTLLPYLPGIRAAQVSGASLRTGFSWRITGENVASLAAFPLEQYQWVWAALLVVVAAGAAAGWFFPVRTEGNLPAGDGMMGRWLFAGVALLAAVAGFGLFLKWAALPTQVWYFLPLFAVAAACLEMGLPTLPGRGRLAVFGLFVLSAVVAIPFAWLHLQGRFTNIDRLAGELNTQAAPQDFVLVSPWTCGISFERYFKSTTPWSTIPPVADHASHRYDLVQEAMKTPGAMRPLLAKISETLQSGHRVWIVGMMDIPAPGTPAPADLPPPPLKWTGWSDTTYNLIWDAQIAHFISDRSRRFERLPPGTNVWINFNECLQLLVAEGWQTNVVSPPLLELPIK